MDTLKIYSPNGELLMDALLEDSSSQSWGVMSENQLSIDFYSEKCVVLSSGCYVDFDGLRFWLLDEYKPEENDSADWHYNLAFLGAESLLAITLLLQNESPIFSLTAPANQHLQLIVANLNRRFPSMRWRVGKVPPTENIFIEYAGTYASEALEQIVGEKYEWWVENFEVNVGRCELGELVELGYQNGLIGGIAHSLANNMRSYAYLYPIGSSRNIDPSKYGHDRLQLPNGQTLVDINPEQGLAELAEEQAFANIYPRYVGTVTSVRTTEGKNSDGTTFLIYHIQDSAIPFNPNDYELPGEVKHIEFLSGELMGEAFEVNYDADAQEFEIITRWPNNGDAQLPGGLLVPGIDDKYVVWNISMPDEYYPLAEQEFLEAVLAFARDSVKDASVYNAVVDYIDIQARNINLRPGRRVRLLSEEYFPREGYYDSRIVRISRDICYPDELRVEISTVRSEGTISRLRSQLRANETQLNQLGGSLKNYVGVLGTQNIFGVKNFVEGFKLGGVPMYKLADGPVYLE